MFFGTHTPQLDNKGRLFLPAQFSDALMAGLVVTRGRTAACPCDTLGRLRGGGGPRPGRARPRPRAPATTWRFLYSNANEDTPDKQGRITITSTHREYARLTRT